MNAKKILAAVLCMAMMMGALVGCSDKPGTSDKVKVGIIYISTKTDGGWSEAHATGFANAVKAIGEDKVELVELESINDADAAATEAGLRQLAENGCQIIFATSYGYMDTVESIAAEYPDIKFEHCSGTKSNSTNFDNYFAQIEQGRYLTGIMAGLATKTDKIGYVAAQPFAEVIRGINAFTMGVRSVNPDAEVYVEWTMSWFDPDTEKENAIALINKGCDVMAQHQDSPAAVQAAEEAGIFSIGYDFSMAEYAPKGYLSAPIFNWGAYYEKKIKAVIDDKWTVENTWGGLSDGMVDIDAMSANVSDEAKALVATMKATLLKDGNDAIFVGPIKDNEGNEVVKSGVTLTKDDQYAMTWLVEGVVGKLPG